MSGYVEIFEMGPRDGLQNEKRMIGSDDKIALVDLLSDAGFRRIEVTSFVSPKWVPQMGDAAQVMAGIRRAKGVSYAVLTPNMKGYEGAKAARADEVAVFTSASEGFAKANLNATIDESFERFAPIMDAAKADGIPVRGYVSVVTDCPFDGPTAPENVARVAARLLEMGCYEISLGDTIGQGRPETIDAMLTAVLQHVPADKLAGHYHDTAGRALQNIDASIARGVRVFDAAVGGLGGCPYAPGAAGNVATEKVADHLKSNGYETNLDMDVIARAADFARGLRSGGQAE
ncbi:hydroxymethylglutaryl-CoA lyase [Paracoccus albus]|uniref:hydroxymethylglutaryl-CoA lyase n=1 Tax=Paracoccus albus TaxID=3017784 RepID=UPI0022F0106A|nr:hydroxymethylglutaryl-CoA lyase [Paracoccus albus]WBU61832.1 hydroxymethylglutaryl-CoA lyase [Paracoccus albus]